MFTKMEATAVLRNSIKCAGKDCQYSYCNLWMCTFPGCYHIGCGRRDNAHAAQHNKDNPSHALPMKLNTMELWCYTCKCWPGCLSRSPIEQERVAEIQQMFLEYCKIEVSKELSERRKRERNLPHTRRPRHNALVPLSWTRRWERFIIGDCDYFFDRINTETLLNSAGTGVASNKFYSIDYGSTSIEAWVLLASYYGSGPLISYDFQLSKVRVGDDTDVLLRENSIYEKMWESRDEE